MSKQHPEFAGIAFGVAAAVAFGTLGIFAKYAYRAGADAVPLLGARFALSAVLIAAFAGVARRPFRVARERLWKLLLLGALGYGFESTLFFIALEHAPASVVGLVFYSYPLWTTLGALATGLERFKLPLAGALALGSAGVVMVFSLPEGGLKGPLIALAAAVAVAVYFLAAQVLVRGVDSAAVALWTSTGAAVATGGVALATQQSLPAEALPPAVGLAVVTAFAFVCMFGAIARIGSSRFAIAAMLEPVTTVVLAAIFLGESLGLRVVLGTALIVAALPVLALSRQHLDVPAADSV